MSEQMRIIYDFLKIDIHDKKYKKYPESLWIGTIPWPILMLIFSTIADVVMYTYRLRQTNGSDFFIIALLDVLLICGDGAVVYFFQFYDTLHIYDECGYRNVMVYPKTSVIAVLVKYICLIILNQKKVTFNWTGGLWPLLYASIYILPGIYLIGSIIWCMIEILTFYFYKKAIDKWSNITKYNETLYQSMQERERMYPLQQMLEYKVMQPMMKAIRYYNEENYEDALANVRKSLELYLHEKLLYNNAFFSEAEEISIYNLIVYFAKKDFSFRPAGLHEVRRNCNQGVHALGNEQGMLSDKEKTEKSIRILLDYILEAQSVWKSNEEYLTGIEQQITLYVEKADKHIECGEYEDALLNFRRILECVVNGYMHHFSIVCTHGNSTDLNGFIDTLFAKRCITEKSQKNMHYIRKMGNKSAHGNERILDLKKLNDIYVIVKDEIHIYKKCLQMQGNLSLESFGDVQRKAVHRRSEKTQHVCVTEKLEEEAMRIIADNEVFEIFGTHAYKDESGDYHLSLFSQLHEIVIERLCYEEVEEIITELYEKGKMNLNNYSSDIRYNNEIHNYT